MKMKKFLAAIAALAMATVPTMAVNAQVANGNELNSYDNTYCYKVSVNDILPEGRSIDEVAYMSFTFSGYDAAQGCGGGIFYNTETGGWPSSNYEWGNASAGKASSFPDDGSDLTVYRDIADEFDNPGGWAEIWIQHWWGQDITILDINLLDAGKNVVGTYHVADAPPPPETTPSETEATTPAPSETEATTEATTAATTTAAATTKATTTKANPTTGESNTGVALAVTAAMAAAGVAVTFGKKKK